ncbi:MAG: putative MFS family arabinose efflux permease [Halieaceae bacterium]
MSRPSRRLLVASIAAVGVGNLGFWVLPLTIGILVDSQGYSQLEAGYLTSVEVGAIAFGSFAIVPFTSGSLLRKLAMLFAVVVMGANVLSTFALSFEALAVCRFICGFGGGVILASGYAAIGRTQDPDRLYALVFVLVGIAASILLAVLPQIVKIFGGASYFLTLACMTSMLIPAYLWNELPEADKESIKTAEVKAMPRQDLFKVSLLLTAIFLVAFLETCVWTYVERRGLHLGINEIFMGYMLGICTVAGVSGGVLASVIGSKYGRAIPIAFALLLQGFCAAIMYMLPHQNLFFIGLALWSFCLFLVYPYLLGAAASFPNPARWTVIGGALMTVGSVFAPTVSGFVIGAAGYQSFAWMLIVLSALALLLASISLRSNSLRHDGDGICSTTLNNA